MKRTLPIVVMFACGALSCADMKKDPYELDSNSLKIGVITNLTGALATFGRSMFFAIELAAQEINNAGGVNGQKVELIRKDDRLSTTIAAESASELVNEGAVGMIADSIVRYLSERSAEHEVRYAYRPAPAYATHAPPRGSGKYGHLFPDHS